MNLTLYDTELQIIKCLPQWVIRFSQGPQWIEYSVFDDWLDYEGIKFSISSYAFESADSEMLKGSDAMLDAVQSEMKKLRKASNLTETKTTFGQYVWGLLDETTSI